MSLVERVAQTVGVAPKAASATIELFNEGATVPFIARYRKERTGGLDETQIVAIRDTLARLEELEKRRDSILGSLSEQGVLTPELERAVRQAETLAALEDLYLPYRPKKRTRATAARERGLEPLAELILLRDTADPRRQAEPFVSEEKDVATVDDAIAGACDIIAERIAEDSQTRAALRSLYSEAAVLRSRRAPRAAGRAAGQTRKEGTPRKGDDAHGEEKYRDYYEWSEPAARAPSHRILAVLRGAAEKELVVHASPPEERALTLLSRWWAPGGNEKCSLVRRAAEDGYGRLLEPALENELISQLKQRADVEAVRVFAANLRELLMAPPLGGRPVLAVDPGFRTGCKLACLDAQGNLRHFETVYPLEPHNKTAEAASAIRRLAEQYRFEAIAVGNGTGGREMISFCRGLGLDLIITMVNESGASVYSASAAAREEFPDQDVTVRGAISIGRRLMDPLAELVKIDPKSIGVGQYQHDVDQKMLRSALQDVVESCVNAVGVEVNTASVQLLSAVAGLSERIARSIISYRTERKGIRNRMELTQVKGLGERTFEQCAGFLRIRGGENVLDQSGVHPESYGVVEAMAKDLGATPQELMQRPELRRRVELATYVTETVGMPTLKDIMSELEKPGRDPRSRFEAAEFSENVHELGDLSPGMQLPGIVTNVTAFGAFVDVGVHQDGLVHISELADRYVKEPAEIVRTGQPVTVTVLSVDTVRKRVSLSMKSDAAGRAVAARTPG
ncbi:Tex family protein [Salinispira pacifica]